MNNNYNQAKNVCIAILSNTTDAVNAVFIKDTINKVMVLFHLEADEQEKLFEELEQLYAVFSDQYRILDDKRTIPWIKNAKADIPWDFWNRYRKLLEMKNYAPDTINKLDDLTDDILDRLARPGQNLPFDKKGLIVGQIQSGKTGNYIGLICKAADAGYRLIVVLAGIHNSLRSQTQLRIDEGFLGFDTMQARNFARTSNRIGVGRFNPNLAAHSLTTNEINGDFNRRASESSGINIRGNDPIILVIKKNVSVMRNLLGWLASRGETMTDGKKLIKSLPLLVIDDEADNASINISKDQVSSINACIRSLLKLFEQAAYVGYTATPYANIFIRQYLKEDTKGLEYQHGQVSFAIGEDIFPRNFIINIPAPSNYIGPEKLFGIVSTEEIEKEVRPLPLLTLIDDYEPKKPVGDDEALLGSYRRSLEEIRRSNTHFIPDQHKLQDALPNDIPKSLKDAIRYFFLSCAARRARGQVNEHNSMLIHVSRYVDWQDKIATLVLNEVKFCARQIEFNFPDFLSELRETWEMEFVPVTRRIMENPSVNDPGITPLSWKEVSENLYPAAAKIEVRAVHGDTRIDRLEHKNIRPLDYYDNPAGLSVIAVGGNKLSRGLTLEGLTISYFLRSAKMYDTLMQMGRWFGYRPGYLDLCRLFTSAEIAEWYQHITIATEEMRAEFDRMSDLDKTPEDYGLKVRTHPGVLAITAANKFRYKEIMQLSYSRELEETYSFRKHSGVHAMNYNRVIQFVNELGLPGKSPSNDTYFKNHYVWRGRDNAGQLINFLSSYKTNQPSFNTNLICEYIDAQQAGGLLTNWTIALINSSGNKTNIDLNLDVKVGLTIRNDSNEKDSNYYIVSKSHIIDPWHEYIDLTDQQSTAAFEESIKDAINKKREPAKVRYPSPLQIKMHRPESNGLLLIYLLDPKPDKTKPALADFPIAALALSFPNLKHDKKIEYAVNEQFIRESLNYPDELDELEREEETGEDAEEANEGKLQAILDEMKAGPVPNRRLLFKVEIGRANERTPVATRQNQNASAVPLFSSRDIGKYYLPPNHDSWVGHGLFPAGKKQPVILAPAIFRAPSFALTRENCQVDESCVVIIPEDNQLPPEYLLATLNSVLFSFAVALANRVGARTEDAIDTFPVQRPRVDISGITRLVQCVSKLQQNQLSRQSMVMAGFFINVIDAAVLEVYFPGDFINGQLSVLKELALLPPFDGREELAAEYFSILHNPDHPVEKTLYALPTIEKFNLVYNNLKPLPQK